jgi:hypothetical protein
MSTKRARTVVRGNGVPAASTINSVVRLDETYDFVWAGSQGSECISRVWLSSQKSFCWQKAAKRVESEAAFLEAYMFLRSIIFVASWTLLLDFSFSK